MSSLVKGTHSRSWMASLFAGACGLAALSCVAVLIGLLVSIVNQGRHYLSLEPQPVSTSKFRVSKPATGEETQRAVERPTKLRAFLTSMPSSKPEKAGIWPALLGTVILMVVTLLVSIPLGLGAAIYLEEYARPSRVRDLVQLNISNLAGVPAIVYGILGLGLFVRYFGLNESILAGGLTLSLITLPTIILTSQEALRGVPNSIRHASFGLGASRWQTVWRQVLPAALPGIISGAILGLSRAIGEAAPLITVGAASYVQNIPTLFDLNAAFTALPIQIYDWTSDPSPDFQRLAASAIVVLMLIMLTINAFGSLIRWSVARRLRQ